MYPLLAARVGGEIIDGGPVAKVVLLILLIFSLVSWAIIVSKWSVLQRARVQSSRPVRAFRKAQRLQCGRGPGRFRPPPSVRLFEGGFEELPPPVGIRSEAGQKPAGHPPAFGELEGSDPLCSDFSWLVVTGSTRRLWVCSGRCGAVVDAFHGLGTAGASTWARSPPTL